MQGVNESGADNSVLNGLVTSLYAELRRIAGRHLRAERSGHTIRTTALVNEAYVKLCGAADHTFTDRAHLLSVASRVMRQVLVDYARARATEKRGGDGAGHIHQLVLSESMGPAKHGAARSLVLLDVNRALDLLAEKDPDQARVIEMRYFGGMTAEETAEVLGCSPDSVRYDLRLAQAWLRRELSR